MTITGGILVAGLIGYPLNHTISPIFQQAAFDHLKLPIRYEAWPTPPTELAECVQRARGPHCIGFNVTGPHKQNVIALLDGVDDRARQIGAVNTVVKSDGGMIGHNTDAEGFIRPLRERGISLAGSRATIIGSGGVARAAAFALAWAGAGVITVAARNSTVARLLAADVARQTSIECVSVSLHMIPNQSDIVVNCTSVGMRGGSTEGLLPIPIDTIPERALVYDLVYNPRSTALLVAARQRGSPTLDGFPMVVYQGAAAFTLWTGRPAPVELMMSSAEAALPR